MADLLQMADGIAEAVRPLGGQSRELNRSMTVVVPAQKSLPLSSSSAAAASGPLPPLAAPSSAVAEDLPDQAFVVLDRLAAELFGLAEDEQCPWPRFRDAARRCNFDVRSLARAVHYARSQQAVPTSLEQFRAARDRLRYRPMVFSVDAKRSGELRLKLVFWTLTGEAEPELFNAFERVRLLFNLATRFRRQVGKQHAEPALRLRRAPEQAKVAFLKRVLHDIERLAAEAEADDLADGERLIEAFAENRRD